MKGFLANWGGLAGAIGGAAWAIFMVMLAFDSTDSMFQAMQAPPTGLLLTVIVVLLAVGFSGIAFLPQATSLVKAIATICAGLAVIHSLAVFIATVIGFKPAYFLGILAEPALTLGFLALGLSALASPLPTGIKVLPLLMAVVYAPSYVLDPGAFPPGLARAFPDLLAALYGVLWVMLGLLTFQARRTSNSRTRNPGGA